eukprot:SAG31_NODE_39296_length_289_cov_1.052632_1_plen_58_part_01
MITARLIIVKFLNAWNTEYLKAYQYRLLLDVEPSRQIWDLIALGGLLVHRHRLMLRGE